MSIISLASYNSQSHGYDYYEEKKVLQSEQLSATTYHGIVSGSDGAQYDVTIDVAHPRKSVCTCPHAAGRRIICKHMVALFFTIFPDEADAYVREVEESWKKAEMIQEEIADRLEKTIRKMKKSELQEALLDLLSDCAEWQYDRFVRTYVDLEDLYY